MNGIFEVQEGRLNIEDPLYIGERVECAAYDLPARNGRWNVTIVRGIHEYWGERVEQLICRHASLRDDVAIDVILSSDIGVDSATVCVYETPENIADSYTSPFDLAIGPHGACATSGIGDGTYVAYGHLDGGELVGVRVVFIPDASGRMPGEFL